MANPFSTEFEATKKLIAFAERAEKQGLDCSVDLQQFIDNPAKLRRLVGHIKAGCPYLGTGFSYDAATVGRILGIPCECSDPIPEAEDGKVDIYYGGWTLGKLVATGKVVNHLSKEYEKWKAPPGYYRVLIPVPRSDRMKRNERIAYANRFYDVFKELPTPVVATVLAVHLGVISEDLMQGGSCFCAEMLPDHEHPELDVHDGCVFVNHPLGKLL